MRDHLLALNEHDGSVKRPYLSLLPVFESGAFTNRVSTPIKKRPTDCTIELSSYPLQGFHPQQQRECCDLCLRKVIELSTESAVKTGWPDSGNAKVSYCAIWSQAPLGLLFRSSSVS